MAGTHSLFRSFVLTLLLALGALAVWGLVSAWCFELIEQNVDAQATVAELIVRLDGQPLVRTYRRGSYQQQRYATLEGQQVSWDSSHHLPGTQLSGHPVSGWNPWGFVPVPWSLRISSFNDGREPAEYWYFVHDGRPGGAGYFVGFDSQRKTSIGYLSEEGFSATAPLRSKWFSMNGRLAHGQMTALYGAQEPMWRAAHRTHLVSRNRLLEVDFRQHTVRPLFEAPGMYAVGQLTQALEQLPSVDEEEEQIVLPQSARRLLVTRAPDRVVLHDLRKGTYTAYRLPEALQPRDATFYLLSTGQLLAHSEVLEDTGRRQHLLVWLRADGTVARRVETVLGEPGLSTNKVAQACWMTAAVPAPIATAALVTWLIPGEELIRRTAPDYSTALSRSLRYFLLPFLVLCLLSALAAWWAARHNRRYALRCTWLWIAFVFLLGPPGLLAYLTHRVWPTRERCELCGEPSPRDRNNCAACGQNFPEPALLGTEVLG